jgi:hypothetical protein
MCEVFPATTPKRISSNLELVFQTAYGRSRGVIREGQKGRTRVWDVFRESDVGSGEFQRLAKGLRQVRSRIDRIYLEGTPRAIFEDYSFIRDRALDVLNRLMEFVAGESLKLKPAE